MVGSGALVRTIVWGLPWVATSKGMVLAPAALLAFVMARRSEPAPSSRVLVTTNGLRALENSLVCCVITRVAVAVMKAPAGSGIGLVSVARSGIIGVIGVIPLTMPVTMSVW